MKIILMCLVIAVIHFTVHSIPTRDRVEQTGRVPGIEDSTIDNGDLQFARDLASSSLPNYLKDLYTNFTFPSKHANVLKNQQIAVANTIRSYENKAQGEQLHYCCICTAYMIHN